MTTPRILELALAVLIFAAGVYLYTRRTAENARYGSQGAVLLFAVGAIAAIHALGGLDYHPSQAELDRTRAQ